MGRMRDREVWRLALPAIASNVTVPLLGICDTAISGHLGSPVYLAAIAAGSMMLNVIFWLFGFLRAGTTGLAAEAVGQDSARRQREIFTQSFWLAIGVGMLILLLSPLMCDLLLRVVGVEPEAASFARKYFTICIFGAPAQLGIMAANGWMIGMQTTTRPMIVAISVNVINIILSLTAVFGLRAGFVGIAYGTMISNWLGLCLALILARGKAPGKKLFAPFKTAWKTGAAKFAKVNTDLFFRSMCIMAVSLAVTSIGARLGNVTMAANAVLMQFFLFFSYFMDGFAYAAEAMVGKASGAKDHAGIRSAVITLLKISAWMAGIFVLIYLFFTPQIVGLLTDEPSVRAAAVALKPWMVVLPVVSVACFIFDGFYIGLTETRRMLWATLLAVILFFGISFIHKSGIGLPDNPTLWTAFLSYLLLRGVLLAFFLKLKKADA